MFLKKKRVALIVAQTLAIQAAAINASSAATVLVTNAGDAGAGCTFREAVTTINNQAAFGGCIVTGAFSNNTVNDINFAPNANQISLTQGQVEINNSVVTINNTGQEVTISGDGTDRLLKIDQSTVEVNTVTLTGGVATGDGTSTSLNGFASNTGDGVNDDGGGAIHVDSSTLTLNNSNISGNTAAGIRNPEIINGYQSYENFPSYGGGIYSISSTVTLNDSSVSNNTLLNGNTFYIPFGLGIFANSTTLILNNSSVLNNIGTGSGADGVEMRSGVLTVNNSNISGNSGGGISAGAEVVTTINNSTMSGNGLQGLGISNGSINNSTISGNNLDSDFFSGSALNVGSGEVTVNNSTIANNLYNGAIFVNSATLTLNNTTVTGNKRAPDPRPSITLPETGGIDILRNVTLNLNNSIIAGNRGINGGGNEIATPTTQSIGNIFQSGTNITLNVNNSILGDNGQSSAEAFLALPPINGSAIFMPTAIDNILAPLADNGGPTQTNALVEGSPAIDAGDCITHPVGTEDQRGEPRIQGDACDLGAFEGSVQATTTDETIFTIPLPNNNTVIFGL